MGCKETDYIKRLKKGEETALEFIIDRFLPLVKGTVYKVLYQTNKKENMEECISDVFLAIWNHRDQFSGTEDLEFKKWIYKIAKFKAIDYYRKNCRCREFTTDIPITSLSEHSAEDTMMMNENRRALLNLMEEMESPDREIFILKYFMGLNTDEIASRLGLTCSAVDNRIYRGKKKLHLKINGLEAVSV